MGTRMRMGDGLSASGRAVLLCAAVLTRAPSMNLPGVDNASRIPSSSPHRLAGRPQWLSSREQKRRQNKIKQIKQNTSSSGAGLFQEYSIFYFYFYFYFLFFFYLFHLQYSPSSSPSSHPPQRDSASPSARGLHRRAPVIRSLPGRKAD